MKIFEQIPSDLLKKGRESGGRVCVLCCVFDRVCELVCMNLYSLFTYLSLRDL